MTPALQKSQKVLIYRLGSLGDTVIALPALHLTAKAFPNAERRMLTTFPPNAKAPASSSILAGTGLVHGYLRYNYGTRSVRELLALWWRIVKWRPDLLVYMGGPRGVDVAKRDSRFFWLCGIRKQIGIPITEDLQSYRSSPEKELQRPHRLSSSLEFECARLLRCLSALGSSDLDDPANWDLHLTPQEYERANDVLAPLNKQPFIAVSLGTKNQSNHWGRDNWCALLSRLGTAFPGYALVLCGALAEKEECDFVASGWNTLSPSPALNFCGLLTPRESAAVFTRAALFVGHDSGPMHLAASVQTPCVGVFSARNLAKVWFPYGRSHKVLYHDVDCQGCGLQTCTVQRKKCIFSITVDEVFQEVANQLMVETLSI